MTRYYDHALSIWQYLKLDQSLQKTDALLLLGSSDLRVGERAAELYHQGIAPLLIISGGEGRMTCDLFEHSEAETFAKIAMDCGVPHHAILLEDQSTNTGENFRFTLQLLESKGLTLSSVTLVQKPYMERRALATCQQLWPQVQAQVSSPQLEFLDYCSALHPSSEVINLMVGEIQRLKTYPKQGFFAAQDIPESVEQAFSALCNIGYDEHIGV
ncbi:YdcF family protein [Vibrio litoralis]|uniref:YdcF family protein n=1 Tax=Vibrio litoralis TaxID=335972 RepID=UPI0004069E33|nr:YdcF family protein [Vibrio litoralis]